MQALVKTQPQVEPVSHITLTMQRGHSPEEVVGAWLKFMGAMNQGELDEF